jgi:hypothetical protein
VLGKKRTPIATTAIVQATKKTASPGVTMAPLADADDDYDTNTHSGTDMHSNQRATGATGRWTTEEDGELTSAFAKKCRQTWGKEYKTDWAAETARVAGRTRFTRDFSKHSIDIARATGHQKEMQSWQVQLQKSVGKRGARNTKQIGLP